jgi:hypothetical protein
VAFEEGRCQLLEQYVTLVQWDAQQLLQVVCPECLSRKVGMAQGHVTGCRRGVG